MLYNVEITETRKYFLEIEAESEKEAEEKSFNDFKFAQDLCDETDAMVTKIERA